MTFEDVMAIICAIGILIWGILIAFGLIVYLMLKKSFLHFQFNKIIFLWNLWYRFRKVYIIYVGVLDVFMMLCLILFVVF